MYINRFGFVRVLLFLAFISIIIVVFSIMGMYLTFEPVSNMVNPSDAHTTFPVIIIDAGHGGEDGGAEANGVTEKNINLSISQALCSYLNMSSINCVMTRNDDVLLYNEGEEKHKKRYDILNRIKFAERYDEAIFISIHQNKFEIPKYKGLQVYYSKNNEDSKTIAEIIQNNSKKYIDNNNNRSIKAADYRIKVLDKLKKPAVLVECGFLSNPEEAILLSDKTYQNKMAFVMYLSLLEYLEHNGE